MGKERKDAGNQGIQAVGRAFRILEMLALSERGMSLSDIARTLDVNKQIAFRLLETIEAAGYVYKYPHTDHFTLSYRIANIGHRKLVQEEVLEQANSVIRDLADDSGELVRLAVAEHDRLMWVLAAIGKQWMLNINPNYAPKITLHSTAAGKAWLATMSSDKVADLVGSYPLTRRTPNTIVDRDAFHKELRVTHERGWASSFEESEIGIGAIAAALMVHRFDGRIECVGTLSLSAPSQRMSRQVLAEWAPKLLEQTRKLADMWPQFIN